jgi:hydrogenase maturation protein HypF
MNSPIAPSVAQDVDTFGFMLCYAPLHYLLFARDIEVLVMTSANISDEPLICKNEPALERLGDVADAFLMHDREIHRQVDDSILQLIDDKPTPLRRARGYVPTPIFTEEESLEDVFAAGADLKNTFCFAKKNQLICSEHIGDLEDAEVYHHYIDSIEHLGRLFEVEPKVIACDLHPGYLSTQRALATPDVKIVQVQHHWAHIASVLAEHGLAGPVIGLVADGTGYGTDGAIWGCECMIASLEKFERVGHLDYFTLPGADKASKEAVRPALSLLKKAYGSDFNLKEFDWLLRRIEDESNNKSQITNRKSQIILEQLEKGVNCVETSSLGRVFDAVAAMLGLGGYNHFDAQLPMALEAVAAADVEDRYEIEMFSPSGEPRRFSLDETVRQIVADVQNQVDVGIISAKFHNTVSQGMLELASVCRSETGLTTAALSGGAFCNRYLTNCLIKQLKQNGFSVLSNQDFPSNDGGISVGQAAIAARL